MIDDTVLVKGRELDEQTAVVLMYVESKGLDYARECFLGKWRDAGRRLLLERGFADAEDIEFRLNFVFAAGYHDEAGDLSKAGAAAFALMCNRYKGVTGEEG